MVEFNRRAVILLWLCDIVPLPLRMKTELPESPCIDFPAMRRYYILIRCCPTSKAYFTVGITSSAGIFLQTLSSYVRSPG